MSATELLQSYSKKLEPLLCRYLDSKAEEAEKISSACWDMLLRIKNFTMRGGKRIRPAFIYYGYKCFRQDYEEEVVFASMCVELLHSYLLIHDDIMDEDEFRRGCMTMHADYANAHIAAESQSRASFGNAMATIAGDVASALGIDAIAASNFPPDRKIKAIIKLCEIEVNVCHGQALDVLSSYRNDCREEDTALINTLKTACYTVEGPLQLGGILAGAPDKQLSAFSDYAIPLGQAFQIQDDILGLYGDQKQTGKPIGSDLKEGKKTFLILNSLKRATSEQRNIINNALGNPELEPEHIAIVRSIVEETGALEYSRNTAKLMVEQAKSALPKDLEPDGRDFLLAIADYVVNRNN
jgi:geranylgeranyl diphosphate synthase type I